MFFKKILLVLLFGIVTLFALIGSPTYAAPYSLQAKAAPPRGLHLIRLPVSPGKGFKPVKPKQTPLSTSVATQRGFSLESTITIICKIIDLFAGTARLQIETNFELLRELKEFAKQDASKNHVCRVSDSHGQVFLANHRSAKLRSALIVWEEGRDNDERLISYSLIKLKFSCSRLSEAVSNVFGWLSHSMLQGDQPLGSATVTLTSLRPTHGVIVALSGISSCPPHRSRFLVSTNDNITLFCKNLPCYVSVARRIHGARGLRRTRPTLPKTLIKHSCSWPLRASPW